MIYLKSPQEIEAIREGGHILSDILNELLKMAKPGVTTADLEAQACKRMAAVGATPSFKGYRTSGDQRPFPTALCTSINDEVVHAPATPGRPLHEGDLLKIDIGMIYKGGFTDMAATVPIGNVAETDLLLLRTTRESLIIGIEKCVEGGRISDIGKAVDKHVRRQDFTTVKVLVGHGVGRKVHEDPPIPNYHDRSLPEVKIRQGMVLAIEPMVNYGDEEVGTAPDDWTVITDDGSNSAHFEATVAITPNGTEIMTPIPPFAMAL